jgi:hypothetical protein
MSRPTATSIILGQFVAVLAANGVVRLVRLFPRDAGAFYGGLIGAGLLAISALIVLGYVAWHPTWRKTALGLGALGAGALASLATPWLDATAVELFFRARATQLTAAIEELDQHGRIQEMPDGQRHFKSLNGDLVAFTPAEVDTTRDPDLRNTVPLEWVFARDSIDPVRFERSRQQLIAMRLVEVERTDSYVAFMHDGMLDNLEGFLFVRPGHSPPPLETELFDSMLVRLRPLRDGWYWFATT